MGDFTHFNEEGRAKMVDVGDKNETVRVAVAAGRIVVNDETFEKIKTGGMKKGDVLGTAQIAGIMAAKKTSDIIPMCHPLMLTGIDIKFELDENTPAVDISDDNDRFKRRGFCRIFGQSGVCIKSWQSTGILRQIRR